MVDVILDLKRRILSAHAGDHHSVDSVFRRDLRLILSDQPVLRDVLAAVARYVG
jgi:hypothetical protein